MSSTRRSTRLIMQKAKNCPKLDTDTEIWLRTRIINSSGETSDNEADFKNNVVVCKNKNNGKKINKENDNVLNKMYNNNSIKCESTGVDKLISTSAASKQTISNMQKHNHTPRSSTQSLKKREISYISPDDAQMNEDEVLVSSPKQARQQNQDKGKNNEIITTPGTPTSTPRNIYQNVRRVLSSTETKHLPGREEQLQKLRNFLNEHLKVQPGTGKTASLSLILNETYFAMHLQCVRP